MLKLKVENFDRLADGGPIAFEVDARGFDIGRDQHLDWTLPDKSRFISGKHCEVRFFDGHYWLFDISTNGTFVNNSAKRVQNPYQLNHGDELLIGEYIVSVAISAPVSKPSPKPEPVIVAPPPKPAASDSIWDSSGINPPPIDSRDLMPPVQRPSYGADFLNSVAIVPPVSPSYEAVRPRPVAAADPWGAASASPKSVETSASQPHLAENYAPAPSPPKNAGPANSDFLRRFAQGANLPIDTLAARDVGDLAEEIGQLLNAMAANIMQLLNARAAAKTLSRSGHRTLIQSTENNPLKFMPTPEEALRVMLGAKSASYLGGRQSVEDGFADLKMHQMATLSAMQLAVTRLLADLSPDAVKTAAEGGRKSLLGANKGKFWDQFVDMWAAKAAHHDHGMLGAYMELFAEIYDTESRPKNQ